jgi:hypothetical protein
MGAAAAEPAIRRAERERHSDKRRRGGKGGVHRFATVVGELRDLRRTKEISTRPPYCFVNVCTSA